MAVMTVMRSEGDWTVEDLDALPDDGLRYELVDGVLLVSPSPVPLHQSVVGEIFYLLRSARTDDLKVFVAPLDFRPTSTRSLQPDVLVVHRKDVEEKHLTWPPLLVAEVLSPGTRSVDLLLKRGIYEESGIASYWIVDPAGPTLTVLELDPDGRYRDVARVTGEESATLARPFPVTVTPAALID
jgi:Uma2 family endonuclease